VRALRRILALAALVVAIAVIRDRLMAADEARTGFADSV